MSTIRRTLQIATLFVALLATSVATPPALAAGELTTTILIDETTAPGRAIRDGIVGFVRASNGGGFVAGAEVTVIIIRTEDVIGNVRSETHEGVTRAADGWFAFEPSALFSLPGEYFVIARVANGDETGQATTTYFVK